MSTDTPDATTPPLATAWALSLDLDDPAVTRDERLAAIRALLTRRINSTPQPSRSLNQLQATHQRFVTTSTQLAHMAGRAPRILSVVRHALREAFGMDPDTLLFSESIPARPDGQVNSLTDRALALFSDPGVPINLHHYTTLSLKTDPACRLAFNASQALERVGHLRLLPRINAAASGYWQQLADGSWLTRRERWAQLRTVMFADQANLAHQLFQLSTAGYAMARQLVDAPAAEARQRAGGAWATLQVRTVAWPHGQQGLSTLPGALHLYREGTEDGCQVFYLPGLQRAFHEFSSWRQAQAALPGLIQRGLLSLLWQYLPLKRQALPAFQLGVVLQDHALDHSAEALLDAQWSNEWGSLLSLDYAAPSSADGSLPSRRATRLLRYIEKGRMRLNVGLPFETLLDELLEWDRLRRQPQILLASLSPDLPRNHCERHLRDYENRLQRLRASPEPAGESAAYQAFVRLERERQAQAQSVRRWAQGEPHQLFQAAFWLERADGTRKRATLVLNAQRLALRQAVQLEFTLGVIDQQHRERLLEVINKPLATQRMGSDTCVLRVAVANGSHNTYPLQGVFVVTTTRALAEPAVAQPVLLVVGGAFGGLAVFEHLQGLSHALRVSFASPDGSVLWRCIGRDLRSAARFALTRSMEVSYSVAAQDVLYEDFKTLIEHHAALERRLGEPTRVFSEVSDPSLARLLLADELREHLQVPTFDARTQAMANLDFMRFAAEQAKTQPAWLAATTPAQRKQFKRLQRRYLGSALALEERLWQVLPPLHQFARKRLVAQLTLDGFYPPFDVDAPLLEMPDDVSSHFCGWSSQCGVGDRHVKMTVSPERTTFSLLDLALHNLDPQAPWTEWRLNRARYLLPAWKDRMTPRYLIRILSALDIGGHYNALIKRAFNPASTLLERRLINRATQHLARMQVYSAAQQGLSAQGQRLFTTAMAARTADDLRKNGLHISLEFVRLRGYTMAHDRHLAGLLVIVEHLSRHCLVYWPAAQGHPVLSEYASRELAKVALNRLGASGAHLNALAQRVAPGWEGEALVSYPEQPPVTQAPIAPLIRIIPTPIPGYAVLQVYEAIRRFVHSFRIRHTLATAQLPAIEEQIKEQIDAEPCAWLDIVPTSYSHTEALLAHARMLEVQQRAHAQATSAALLAQYREQRLGEQADATVRGLLSFVPLIGVGISLYEMLLAARRFHLSGRPEDAVDVAFMTLMVFIDVATSFIPGGKSTNAAGLRRGLSQLHRRGASLSRLSAVPRPTRLLERFKRPLSTDKAVALQGPGERGVFVKHGELFVLDGEHRYPVYRRGDDGPLRLKSPTGEAEGELVLILHEDREWSLGADAPPSSPQPGPSSAVWRPFAVPGATEWSAPPWAALEQRMRQTLTPPATFESWATTRHLTLTEAVPARGVFEVSAPEAAQSYRVVQYNGHHYRVLPDGSKVSARDLIFITRDRPLEHSASLDVAYWLEVGAFDQPIPATFGSHGQWVFHRTLFNESLRVSLSRAFPTMTANSRTYLIARLLEVSDRSPRLTATHLLDLKATLDKWLAPNLIGHTDDLLKLLRRIDSNTSTSLYIGHEPTTPGFERVDFTLRQRPHTSLREPTQYNLSERAHVMQHAVREVLERQGFIVRAIEKKTGAAAVVDFSCTHPQSDNLYFVLTRWANGPSIKLYAAHGMQLTDEWFAHKFTAYKYATAFAPVKQAMNAGRLVRIVAGIQWTPTAPPTVYLAKFGSIKSGAVPHRRQPRKRLRLPD